MGLKKELKNAKIELDILKKAVGIFSKGDGGIYRFIAEPKAIYPVEKMSSLLNISTSSYYK